MWRLIKQKDMQYCNLCFLMMHKAVGRVAVFDNVFNKKDVMHDRNVLFFGVLKLE